MVFSLFYFLVFFFFNKTFFLSLNVSLDVINLIRWKDRLLLHRHYNGCVFPYHISSGYIIRNQPVTLLTTGPIEGVLKSGETLPTLIIHCLSRVHYSWVWLLEQKLRYALRLQQQEGIRGFCHVQCLCMTQQTVGSPRIISLPVLCFYIKKPNTIHYLSMYSGERGAFYGV